MHTLKSPIALVGVGVMVTFALTACSGGATDEPTTITMWARSSTDAYSQALVDAFNASHETQVELTVVPNDNFQQKVGSAAGSDALPDLLASDVVYAANYTQQGLYTDITSRVEALDFGDALAQAHLDASSREGAIYAVPHKVDSSFMFYNKDLFEQAGLDPDSPPLSYDEIYDAAAAVDALGGDVNGFAFGGNCAGCLAYTMFANLSAGGNDPFTNDGTVADFDNSALAELLDLYARLYADGIAAEASMTEDGSTWQELFIQGKVGLWPNGSYSIPTINENADFEWGYAPLTNADGSATGTFVGGDVLGISASSKNVDAAWEFIEWSLSEEAQVEIVAKNGDLPARTDLAGNEYTAADPRMTAIVEGLATGYTPSTLIYGEAVNTSTGPWLQMVRGVIFNGEDDALSSGQSAVEDLLAGS